MLSQPDGTWRFEALPPGRYYIGTNVFESPDDTVFQPWWHASPGRPAQPARVDVSHDRVTRLELRVGPLFERTALSGRVVDPGRNPVAHANVMLVDVDSAREYLFAAFTEADGRFTIPVVRGRTYRIAAASSVQPPSGEPPHSAWHDVGDFGREVRLVIPEAP